MDLEHFAQAPDLEQERRLVNEESLALCEAAQAVLDEDAELARVLHGLFYGEDEQDFMALSGEHPFKVARGLVGYWLWVLASAGLNAKASKGETPPEILRRRNEPVLQGLLRDVVEEACVSRLSLYEVQAVEGPRIQILDLLAKGAEPVWVDTYPSQVFFVPWDIMGLRILGIGRSFRASHSVHFFSREQGLALARILRIAMRKNARLAHPLPWVLLVDQPIVRAWFDNILNRDMQGRLRRKMLILKIERWIVNELRKRILHVDLPPYRPPYSVDISRKNPYWEDNQELAVKPIG